jgi:hypothetical protein
MSNLEKAKEIVKTHYSVADCGIFNSQNSVGDAMQTIYKGEGLTIDICYNYSYFEVFGLSDAEFEELERYYDSLEMEQVEQNPIFDKIRAEIMKLQTYKMFEGEDAVYVKCEDVLQIIDKYTTESEVEE